MVVVGFLGSCAWLWMVVGSCGWLWIVVGCCGWLWMVVGGFLGGCGWLSVVSCFSITHFDVFDGK